MVYRRQLQPPVFILLMAGDKLDVFGKSYYFTNNTGGSAANSTVPVLDLLGGFLNNANALSSVNAHGQVTPSAINTTAGTAGISSMLSSQTTQSNTNPQVPKAYINYLFFDEQFKCVGSGFSQVGSNSQIKNHYTELQNIIAPKNGFVYIYCSNESPVNVFFDNVQVVQTRGAILEETHYYPFGLTMAGISSKSAGSLENKKGYNANELQSGEFSDGTGLELYDFNARTYDQQIGRFIQVDPFSEDDNQESFTPYHYAFDNPIQYSDPEGTNPIPLLRGIWRAYQLSARYFYKEGGVQRIRITQGAARDATNNIKIIPLTSVLTASTAGTSTNSSQNSQGNTSSTTNKGMSNPKVKKSREIGQEAHRQIQEDLKNEGAETEVPLTLKDGTKVRKDAVKADGTPVIIKPNTQTGRASAAKREKLLNDNEVKQVEKIFYNPKDPKYLPGSATYIGPKLPVIKP